MTDKEVIKGLQAVNEHIGKHFNEGGAWMAEFIDNAIKLLEQQPITWIVGKDNCQVVVRNMPIDKDCISREAVIRLVEQYPNIIGNRCSGLIADIKHLPPVAPSYNSIKSELKPCEDCVSREEVDDLVDELIRTISDEINYRPRNRSSLAIMHDISNLPSVTPQQEKGEWISVDATHSKCEKCEAIFEIASPNAEVNFCPSCGVPLESENAE